jgi:hypothetical protein
MQPVRLGTRVDQKQRDGAVGFLLCGDGSQTDDDMGFLRDLLEHGRRVIDIGCVALKQLASRHHDLIGSFAATAATAHAVSQYGQEAASSTRMRENSDLVLLVFTITPMDAGRCGKSVTSCHDESVWSAFALD